MSDTITALTEGLAHFAVIREVAHPMVMVAAGFGAGSATSRALGRTRPFGSFNVEGLL